MDVSGVGGAQEGAERKSDGENETEWEWFLFTFWKLFFAVGLCSSSKGDLVSVSSQSVCMLSGHKQQISPTQQNQLITVWYCYVRMRTFYGFLCWKWRRLHTNVPFWKIWHHLSACLHYEISHSQNTTITFQLTILLFIQIMNKLTVRVCCVRT